MFKQQTKGPLYGFCLSFRTLSILMFGSVRECMCVCLLRSITYSCSSEQNDFQKYYSDSAHTNATELKKKYENEQNWIVLLTKTHCNVHTSVYMERAS